jgi:hypothetical protein
MSNEEFCIASIIKEYVTYTAFRDVIIKLDANSSNQKELTRMFTNEIKNPTISPEILEESNIDK